MTEQTPLPPTSDEIRDSLANSVNADKVDLKATPRSFSEVIEEINPQGTRVKLAEWIDIPVVIHSVRFFKSTNGPCAFILFTDKNGELFNALCSWRVVLPKLAAVVDQLPLLATFTQVEGGQQGHYYDIS